MEENNLQEEVMISAFYGKSFIDDIRAWLKWADLNGFLFSIKNNNAISAVAVARPLSNPLEKNKNQYHFDSDGKSIYVDIVCAIKKNDMYKLLLMIKSKLNHCTEIAFKRNGEPKIHTYKNLNRFLKLLGALA